ncbi:MAG: serine/threonine protein kinase [Sphingomonadales bacterium]|nr:MAG: serine/threonine protein kinase [Sphingomonadales bacterium]
MLPPRYVLSSGAVMPGGFGAVVAVHDSFLDRDVLFKYMQDRGNNAQLLNEVQGLSKARSKHVIEIYDVVKSADGNLLGIIIEQLTGKDHPALCLDARRSANEFLRIAYQLATAIRDLHAAGVVHRDIKLANMRQSASGVLKLFDFGLSSVDSGYCTLLNRGTLLYAAPELYAQGAQILPEMDLYAFGVTCWALASDNLPATLHERPPQTSGRTPSISTVLTGLDPSVIDIIDRCLSPNPLQRPSAQEASDVLGLNLVRSRHRGRFVQGLREVYELSQANPFVRISIAGKGTLEVQYDAFAFKVVGQTGDVFINNATATVGALLPEACVLTFGSPALQAGRSYVSFSSSHPEVVV